MTTDFSYKAIHEKYGEGIPCPDDFSFPSHVLDKWAEKQPDQLVLHWVSADFSKERKVTYEELTDLSNRCAIAFAAKGIKKGDKVMVQLPRVVE